MEYCLDHGIFMLDKEIGIQSGETVIDGSDFMAMYLDGFKVTESAEDRTADYILRDDVRIVDICICFNELG